MNFVRYPWLSNLQSPEAQTALKDARRTYMEKGAVTWPQFVTADALSTIVQQASAAANAAFTTDSTHTAYLRDPDYEKFPRNSVYNHQMRTQVASIAFDELPADSPLATLYQHPTLLQVVSYVATGAFDKLFLSADPLGCCSINVFRPGYHHSFHFDESVFSTTLMIQEASPTSTGLFQYPPPLRVSLQDLALSDVASAITAYDNETQIPVTLTEVRKSSVASGTNDTPISTTGAPPPLYTLDFSAGTLSLFCGSRSLHRVTRVATDSPQDRLVAVMAYSTQPGFCNSAAVQKMFWGRSLSALNGGVEKTNTKQSSSS